MHVGHLRPAVEIRMIHFDTLPHQRPVVPAHRVQQAVEHAHARPAAPARHLAHREPRVRFRAVRFHRAQTVPTRAVITAHRVQDVWQ